MTEKDLMIGNYVKDRGGKTLRIDWIEQDKVCQKMFINEDFEVHPMTEYFDYLMPIPITEDILLKAGFNWNITRTALWDSNEFLISKDEDGYYFGVWLSSNGDEYPIFAMTLDYLHTLQNAYRLKTKKDLIINF